MGLSTDKIFKMILLSTEESIFQTIIRLRIKANKTQHNEVYMVQLDTFIKIIPFTDVTSNLFMMSSQSNIIINNININITLELTLVD